MADSDKTLKLLIEMDVIGREDVKAANALLAEPGQAAGDTAKATEDLVVATKKTGKHAEQAGRHHNVNRLIFGEMSKIVPDLGHMLHAAFARPMGPIVLVAIAIAEVREKLRKYNDELDKIPEEELATHTENIKKLKEAWDEAQKAIGDYYAAIATAGEEKDPIKKQLECIKAISDATLDAHKKEIESLGKIEVAYLRAHGGTADQIAAAEERTRKAAEADESKKEFGHRVGSLKAEQETRLKENGQLQAEANAKMKEVAEAKEALSRQQEELKKAREALDPTTPAGKETTKKVEEAQAELLAAQNLSEDIGRSSFSNGIDMKASNLAKVEEAKAKIEQLEQERQAAVRRRINQLEADEHIKEQKTKEAETYSKSAQDRSVTNQGRLRELPGEIDRAGKLQSAKDQGRAITDKINERDHDLGMSLGEAGQISHLNQSQIIEIARQLVAGQLTHAQEIAGLKRLMAQAASQTNHLQNRQQG